MSQPITVRIMFQRPDIISKPLYVITPIFNSQRFRSRWALYKKFEKYIQDSGAILITIELAFGERAFAITDANNPNHIQVRTGDDRVGHELWTKENLINIAISRLPIDWVYVAWIDADVTFARPDWVGETLHELQRYQLVQMFSEAHQLDHEYKTIQQFSSFGFCYHHQDQAPPYNTKSSSYYYTTPKNKVINNRMAYWHPGFAWAARKDAINHLGGLIDWAIMGSADFFMAKALIGAFNNDHSFNNLGVAGSRWMYEWQERANTYINGNIGYVSGTLLHYWHGKRVNRRYKEREQILIDCGFCPELDLKRDWQGVYQLTNRSHKLRDEIRKYFKQRNEDQLAD